MTRFDASDPTERRKLFADAIVAHRKRSSPFTTFRAVPDDDPVAGDDLIEEADDDPLDGTVEGLDAESDEGDGPTPGPWIQYAEREGLLNFDCTDEELDLLKALIDRYPSFRIDDLTRPEEAEGTNAKVSARADP